MVVLDVSADDAQDVDIEGPGSGSESEEDSNEELDHEDENIPDEGNIDGNEESDQMIDSNEDLEKKINNLDNYRILGLAKTKKSRVDASVKLLKHIAEHPTENDYMMKRLLLGLVSTSDASRQSYFVCLVEFLRQREIGYEKVHQFVQGNLRPTGSMSKGEESSFIFARVLADMAVLRSGIVSQKEDKKKIFQNVCSNSGKRSYIDFSVIYTLVEHFVMDTEIEDEFLMTTFSRNFSLKIDSATFDSLYFICAAVNNRKLDSVSFLKFFDFQSVGEKKFLDNAVRIMTNNFSPMNTVISHPLILEISKTIITNNACSKFLQTLIPEAKLTNHKSQIGLAIVIALLKNPSCPFDEVLTNEVLDTIIDVSRKGLPETVVPIIEFLDSKVKSDADFGAFLLPRLLTCTVCWDKISPGSLVVTCVSEADKTLIVLTAKTFMDTFCSDANMSERIYSALMLAKLVAHPTAIDDLEWRTNILNILFKHTVVNDSRSDDTFPPLSKDAKHQLKEVFYRGLDGNCKTLADNIILSYNCMTNAIKLEPEGDCFKDDAKQSWTKIVKLVSSLDKKWKKNKDNKETGMFLMLFSHIGLQLFFQPDMAMDVLSELIQLQSNWSKAKSSEKEGEPASLEVVVEIMLSLLAQNKHLLRNLVKTLFKVISSQLTKPGIQSLLEVIKGKDEDIEEQNEDMDIEEDESENEESEKESDNDEADDKEESDSDSSDESDDESEAPDDDFKSKIELALGSHADKEEESDIDMDDIPDEDMKQLDQKLIQAFKAIGGKKTAFEKKKEKMDHLANQHFKLRVLDLIDIYVQDGPRVENFCIIVPTLLESYKKLYANKKEAPLANRIKSSVAKCCQAKLEHDDDTDISKLLDYLIRFTCHKSYLVMELGQVVPKLCVLVLKLILTTPEAGGQLEAAQKLYLETVEEYYGNPKAFVNHEILVSAVSLSWNGAQKITEEVVKKTFSEEAKAYHRSQGLAILRSYLLNSKLKEARSEDHVKYSTIIINKILSTLTEGIAKARPNQLVELFEILRVAKKQNLLTDEDISAVTAALQQVATSDSKLLNVPRIKNLLKKIIALFGMKVKIEKPKPVAVLEKKQSEKQEEEIKKKKKKSKHKKKNEKEEPDISESAPSFRRFVNDTTRIYVNTNKRRGKKRKHKENPEENQDPSKNQKAEKNSVDTTTTSPTKPEKIKKKKIKKPKV